MFMYVYAHTYVEKHLRPFYTYICICLLCFILNSAWQSSWMYSEGRGFAALMVPQGTLLCVSRLMSGPVTSYSRWEMPVNWCPRSRHFQQPNKVLQRGDVGSWR